MATQGDVKPFVKLVRERVATSETLPKSCATNAYISFAFDIQKTGKTPIGIVGVTGSGTSAFAFEDVYMQNTSSAMVYMRNLASVTASISAMYIDVLYVVD